ncbi:MAG: GHKL domain-containing protein [Clostridiales bacterium]|nr:GHKL domain-containing protein [Clostridiales bacterium]
MQNIIVTITGDLLIAGLSALLVIEYFKTFFEKRSVKAVGGLVWASYYIWQILATYGMSNYPVWTRLLLSIVFVILTSCFFYGDYLGKILFSVLYIAIWMLGECLTGGAFLLLGIPIEVHVLAGSIASKGFLLIFVKALQLFFHNKVIRELSWKNNIALMFLPVGSMFLVQHIFAAEYELNQSGITGASTLCILIVLVINIVVFKLYIRLSENLELKHKNSIYEKEFDLLDVHMKEKEEAMAEFRRRRHDLKHQMTELLNLLRNGQYERLESCIMELADLKSLEGLKIAHTDNSIVDAFVNYKYETAKKNGIEFRVKLDIPTQLPFANGDLCILLGNALDNALEASQRGKVENPYIDLKVKYDGDNLIIIVENTFDGSILQSKRGERITRKADKENHGLGISSIQSVLKKYHGYYDVAVRENVYCLSILLHSE